MWKMSLLIAHDPTKKYKSSQPMGYDAFLKTSWKITLQDNILSK